MKVIECPKCKTLLHGSDLEDGGSVSSASDCYLPHPTGMDQPWPHMAILAKLTEATDILFEAFDYDRHGWEEIAHCRDRAKEILAANNRSLAAPEGSGAAGCSEGGNQ